MKNIVLIGLSGSGKTTVGKCLAESLHCQFVDTDELIETEAGISISEIFSLHGESEFRRLESLAVEKAAARSSVVISTGGGAVLRAENVARLKETGWLVFLDRSTEEILKELDTSNRPLLKKDPETLKTLEIQRRPIYERIMDSKIINHGTAEDAVRQILQMLKIQS